jgi:hypothetical protein
VPASDVPEALSWFGVRCLFRHHGDVYEERVTLWRAHDFAEAIELAEAEAREYAAVLSSPDGRNEYIEFAQAYLLDDEPGHGAEVFSLLRDSDLPPGEYVDRFFDTGEEHESTV